MVWITTKNQINVTTLFSKYFTGRLGRERLAGHGVKIQKTNLDDHGLTETVSLFE